VENVEFAESQGNSSGIWWNIPLGIGFEQEMLFVADVLRIGAGLLRIGGFCRKKSPD